MPHPRRRIAVFLGLLLLICAFAPVVPPSSTLAATPTARLSVTSGNIGSNVTVSYKGFTKNRALKIKWDGQTVATATSSAAGDGGTVITVPNGVKGSHKILVVMGDLSAGATYSIRSQLRLSPTTVTVNQRLSVSLRGYAANESVKLTIDNGTTAIVTVKVSSSGNAATTITVPAATGGSHKLYGKGNAQSSDSASFRVSPSITLIPASGGVGANIRVHLRGYKSGERIELQFRYPDQTSSLGFATASSTGSVNVTFTVPRNARPGTYSVLGVGYSSSVAETVFQVT